MKIGILSDTHDHLLLLRHCLQRFADMGVHTVIHAGDMCSPFMARAFKDHDFALHLIYGNNDGDLIALDRAFAPLKGIHHQPLKLTLAKRRVIVMHQPFYLPEVAAADYDIVIYGHTHQQDIRQPTPGKWIINPGEACGVLSGKATAVVLDLARNTLTRVPLNA